MKEFEVKISSGGLIVIDADNYEEAVQKLERYRAAKFFVESDEFEIKEVA